MWCTGRVWCGGIGMEIELPDGCPPAPVVLMKMFILDFGLYIKLWYQTEQKEWDFICS